MGEEAPLTYPIRMQDQIDARIAIQGAARAELWTQAPWVR